MCKLDPNIESLFVATIDEFVAQNRAFTGYDLTLRTREREKIKLRHADVRQGIHEMDNLRDLVDFGDWSKELTNIGVGEAFLYAPVGFNRDDYKPYLKSTTITQVIPVTQSPIQSITSNEDDSEDADDVGGEKDGLYKTDYRGRLLIPTNYLRSISLNHGDLAYTRVEEVNGKLVLFISKDQPSGEFSSQYVERDGEIRVSNKTLSKLGSSLGDYFKIEQQNNEIAVQDNS